MQSNDPVGKYVDEQPYRPYQPVDMNDTEEHSRHPVPNRSRPAWMLSDDYEL